VLSKEEVLAVIGNLPGTYQLVAKMLYGTGLRLTEVLQLRIKDIDFAHCQIVVRDTKGMESWVTMLPNSIAEDLKVHLQRVRLQHQQDLTQGYGSVYLPFALERKYPHAGYEWSWQYVFPSERISKDPQTGIVRRHYLHESGLKREFELSRSRQSIVQNQRRLFRLMAIRNESTD
jgi:integrase